MESDKGNSYTVNFVSWDSPEAETMKAIRFKVFVDEQKVSPDLELDEKDTEAIHAIGRNSDGVPCGTARMYVDDDDESLVRIGRMAVLNEFRCTGCGTAILTSLLDEARRRRYSQVTLSAQCQAVSFYRKFGFQPVGEIYDDAGIDHQKMVLELKDQLK